jgi:hypothetical protein
MRSAYKTLVGNPERERPLGKPTHRLEDNIKMDLRLLVLEVMDWIHLTRDRGSWRALVNTVMNLLVP